jgi:imidazolonepropionase-like amidohydrolase
MLRTLVSTLSVILLFGCGGEAPPAGTPEQADPGRQAPGAGATAYVGAAIWDGSGAAIQPGRVLLVREGRVEGIVDSAPEGATVVDLAGRFVTPGIINTHGHVSGRWADAAVSDTAERVRGDLALYARYGVTSVLSLGGAPAEAFALRDASDDPALRHARLQVAGEVVVGNTAAAASEMARINIEAGVDWLKLRVDDNLGTGDRGRQI